MFYQWFLHFESSDPEKKGTEIEKTVKYQWEEFQKYLSKPEDEEELLETFMDEVLRTAKGELYQFMMERVEQNNVHIWPDNELAESENYISAVMYLKRKFPEYFEWMAKQAQQSKLKECIQIANGIEYFD